MSDHIKKGRKSAYRYGILATVIVAVVLLSFLFYSISRHGVTQQRLNNINLTDIRSVVGNSVVYKAMETGNVTTFTSSESVSQSGYVAVSVSEFNATPPHSSAYPVLVTSVLYEMTNSSAANKTEQSVLYTAKQPTPRVSGLLYNYTTVTPTTYDNKQTNIYEIASIAVLNSSYIPSVNQYPIYEYTSTFSYGNYVGFVSTSGYENMSQTYSTSIAKLLFQKLINSLAS